MLIFILSWSICLAEMPHVLKNGDIIDAEQLNANFNYLEKFTELDAGSWYPTYANGVLIGRSDLEFGRDIYGGGSVLLTFNPDFDPVLLFKNGEIMGGYDAVQFIEPDCTGDPYINFLDYPSSESEFLLAPLKGRIYTNQFFGKSYYYPPKVQTMYVKIPLSYKYNANCYSYTSTGYYLTNIESGQVGQFANLQDGWRNSTQEEIDIYLSKIMIKLLPNDPAITGLPNAPFPTPITFDGISEAVIIQE